NEVVVAVTDKLARDAVTGRLGESAAVARRKGAGGADLRPVEVDRPRVVDRLDEQLDVLVLPRRRHLDEAAIPGETVGRGELAGRRVLPGVGDGHEVPVALAGRRLAAQQQNASESEQGS